MNNIKGVEILENELPKRLIDLNDILLERASEIDRSAIQSSLKNAYGHIEDILVNGYRYQSREVENILYDVIDQTERDLYQVSEKGRNREIEDKLSYIYSITRREVGKFLELDDSSEGKDIDRLSNNITNRSDEVSKGKSDKVASAHRMLEDEISLEMKNRIKSKLRIYDDPRGEEAYSEISNYINRRLIDEVIDGYQEGSKQMGDIMQQEIEKIVDDIKQEYKMEMAKEEQGKEKNVKDKLGLSDLVNSPEEAFESSKQREEAKEHEIDDKNKDGLITHVID